MKTTKKEIKGKENNFKREFLRLVEEQTECNCQDGYSCNTCFMCMCEDAGLTERTADKLWRVYTVLRGSLPEKVAYGGKE
jgi:hypothetical protein